MSEVRAKLDALGDPFPPQAIEKREGGGGKWFDYVATETVIRRLNATVGVWDFRVTEIKLVNNDQLLVVWGEMSIPGLGTRAGTGVQMLRGGEDMWKGAASDCLKKCATLFGVALDLYGPDLEAGELPAQPNLPPRTRTTTRNTIPTESNTGAVGWTDFWHHARAAGLSNKQAAEAAIGHLGADPAYALERLASWAHDAAQQPALT